MLKDTIIGNMKHFDTDFNIKPLAFGFILKSETIFVFFKEIFFNLQDIFYRMVYSITEKLSVVLYVILGVCYAATG